MSEKDNLFSATEWLRYTRHIQLPQVGVAGQQKLKKANVLVVGAGGLGSPVSLYLAAAGVGSITLIDGDEVDLTNLQRQVVFDTSQVGSNKAKSARQRLLALNPDIQVTAVENHLTPDNAESLIADADLVMDCTDNFTARYLINDTCVQLGKPWLFAAISRFEGQCALYLPGADCFRCLFPQPPELLEDCNSQGVLGVLPGLLGTLQANEAIKFLVGESTPLAESLLLVDALELRFRKLNRSQDLQCPVCGKSGETPVPVSQPACVAPQSEPGISAQEFEALRGRDDYMVLDVRGDAEREAFHIGGQHIPLAELAENLNQLEPGKKVLCYCQSGKRSTQAVKLLNAEGFDASSLEQGLAGWLKQTVGR